MPTRFPVFAKKFKGSPAAVSRDLFLLSSFTFRWLLIALVAGILAGSASAWFLLSLETVTGWRGQYPGLIWLLPLAGLLIGCMYHYYGKDVVRGNNQLIEEIQNPRKIIPLVMAPLVYLGTVITHLFGGSAGREGTAVQMGGAIADQLSRIFRLRPRDRKMLLICGISAGFASVFGTPLAGAVFGLEVFIIGSMTYGAILPCFLSALIADLVCRAWGAGHTPYAVSMVPELNGSGILLSVAAGLLFGVTARCFAGLNDFLSDMFRRIEFPPFRPFAGGVLLVVLFWLIGDPRYQGLGIPAISEAFSVQQDWYVFLIKLGLTALTLGSGFKGGEVTPLFFIGATLGSALSAFVPLPVGLLAAMGLTAVFAGAANTPIACVLLGIELFGAESAVYIALACVVSYLFSGHTGIYGSQVIGHSKHALLARDQNRSLLVLRQRKMKP